MARDEWMSANALLRRRCVRGPACAAAAVGRRGAPRACPAGRSPRRAPAAAKPGARRRTAATPAIVQHIVVQGTQRIEPATVLSYITMHEGDNYDAGRTDRR